MKRLLIAWVLSAAALGGCCVPIRVADDVAITNPAGWVRAEIVCGLNKPAGGAVTDAEWEKFVDEEVTPKFPDGLTLLSGTGQWKGAAGKVERENSRIIVLVFNPAKDTSAESRLHEVAAAYATRFGQEAVLLIRTKSQVEFISPPTTNHK